jgi:hypothetical protein
MTDPLDPTPTRDPVQADPEKYDSPRAQLARARGLETPYIPGGEDPEPEVARREERFYGRILLIMVVVIVLAGFVLGILTSMLQGGS